MDFSHHHKLCNKTQHAQLYENKSILKLVTWFCSSRALKPKCKPRRSSSLGWWKVPDGKVSSLTSAQEPGAQDHTEHVQRAPAPAGLMFNAKKQFLATVRFFPLSVNSLAMDSEYFCGSQGTGLWQTAWPVLCHPRWVPHTGTLQTQM